MTDLPKIESLIAEFKLDLSGVTVITECATGAYAFTGPIAALAGATEVVCLGRDSAFGTFEVAQLETQSAAGLLGVKEKITTCRREEFHRPRGACKAVLITNLRGVRPIDYAFISGQSTNAVVSAMCEFWELRPSDVDLDACRTLHIPVVSTNESHPLLRTIDLVGLLAIQMLFECKAPFVDGNVAIIGKGPFSLAVETALQPWTRSREIISNESEFVRLTNRLELIDAIVVADHEATLTKSFAWHGFTQEVRALGTHVVNISGFPGENLTDQISVWPPRPVPPRTMSRALDVIGYWPVLRLHIAGLKAGSLALGMPTPTLESGEDGSHSKVEGLVERVVR